MPKTMIWAWIKNFIGSGPSLDTKVLCLPLIQIGREANIMFKLNGRLERLLLKPLSIIAADDPVTCAAYAKENDPLALEGWHRFRSLAKKDKVLAREIKQSKIRQVRKSQTYMFGYLIPRNYMEAMQFDSEKNSKWYDAIKLKMESMLEYKVYKKWDKAILDKHKKVMNPPKGYHRIKVHPVFAVKFDGTHKARLVADGHLTP